MKEFKFDPDRYYPTYIQDGAVYVMDEDNAWHIIGNVVNESSDNMLEIDVSEEHHTIPAQN